MVPDCVTCVENIEEGEDVKIEGVSVCKPCVRKMFEQALQFQHCYPPRFGKTLDVNDFADILGKDFMHRYRQKEKEYTALIKDRIYCSCGKFLSGRPRRSGTKMKLICTSCHSLVCTSCKTTVSVEGIHECGGPQDLAAEMEAAGQQKGVHFQVAPCCSRTIERIDGCSEMTCIYCSKHFCFLCGIQTTPGDNHWSHGGGGCPRFDGPNQIYDREPDPDPDPDVPRFEPFGAVGDISQNPRQNAIVNVLVRGLVRREILRGAPVENDEEVDHDVSLRIRQFLQAFAVDDAEDEMQIVGTINDRFRDLSSMAAELNFFWQEGGMERTPRPRTPLQMATAQIFMNLDTELIDDPNDPELARRFEDYHRQADRFISYQLEEHGGPHMRQRFPRFWAFWNSYLLSIPRYRLMWLPSELHALQHELDTFTERTRHDMLVDIHARDGDDHEEQMQAARARSRIAVDLLEVADTMQDMRAALPALEFDGLYHPYGELTLNWLEQHQYFSRVFRRFTRLELREELPLTNRMWLHYLDQLPRDARIHLTEFNHT